MPTRANKRKLEDFNPNKSDSDDGTYGSAAPRASKQKPSRSHQKRPAKRRRRDDESDESELDQGEEESEDESFGEEASVEEVELDPRTGRPKRSSTKKRIKYEESDDEGNDGENGSEEEEEQAESLAEPKRQPGKRRLVKLKLNTPQRPSASSVRTMRSGSVPRGSRAYSNEPLSSGTRRSSRLHHDEQETIVALSNSGHHAEIIRPGTRSPEGRPRKPRRSGKGLKAPATSAILEEEEDAGIMQEQNEPVNEGTPPMEQRQAERGVHEGILSVEDSDPERAQGMLMSDTQRMSDDDFAGIEEQEPEEETQVKGSEVEADDEDEEDAPLSRGRRRAAKQAIEYDQGQQPNRTSRKQPKVVTARQSSDCEFEPEEVGDEGMSSSEASAESPQKGGQGPDEGGDESGGARRSGRFTKGGSRRAPSRRRIPASEEPGSEEAELQEELEELHTDRPRRARRSQIVFHGAPKLRDRKKAVDYRILRPEAAVPEELEPESAPTPSRRGRGGGGASWHRSLFSTYGPFGGAGGPPPILGGPGGLGATGGVVSDSSDDERVQRLPAVSGTVGMTPTSAVAPALLPAAQVHSADALQGPSGTPANLGRIKDRKALADADPLGVDINVNFDSVGGLKDHINQLKEMVSLPLLYPEIFQRFHVTPPRGVLFHGPPGTGKTLLARALAASVSSEGRKIAFYMRKGADALSKWVGEAERQLRLLFEEARANQPSIIFFDEIDGLAPVRSSKQEQIHASIVSTLLALMDGMDGRGQVIVIGATNRPDSIDPALRRPGRFDREFYFPLPAKQARRSILDIHTKDWKPGLATSFKDQLAELTKGYGGADLRALCTEAALNAVQRRYPQIYTSNEKLKIDPSTISITAKDFMISVNKIVPSSERSASSGAAPLPAHIDPLLRKPLTEIQALLSEILPQGKKLTALEEAQYEDYHDPDGGFQRERLQQDFETSRIFRPRLLVRGLPGMGQQYIAKALLNHFEGLHVQSFDLSVLLSDSTRSPEAAVVQLFAEVRQHKPSVIFIPNVDTWYRSLGGTAVTTFLSLLRSLLPTDPVLLLGILESESTRVNQKMLRDLFGFSRRNQFELNRADEPARRAYFATVVGHIRRAPSDFPDPRLRRKRKIEQLEIAPPPPPPGPPTKEERRAQKKKDRQLLNLLKIRIQPVMDQIKQKYKKFRTSIIEDDQIRYLYDEQDPSTVSTDMLKRQLFRPFEKACDKEGLPGLLEVESGKFYYNLNTVLIEERLSNGYYKRPKDFLADIRTLAKDARTREDRDRTIKANEILANVEVDMASIEMEPYLADCENVYQREMARMKEKEEKRMREAEAAAAAEPALQIASNAATIGSASVSDHLALVPFGPEKQVLEIAEQPHVTPTHPLHHASLSNGFSGGPAHTGDRPPPLSNGSSVPSKSDGDAPTLEMHDGHTPHQGTLPAEGGRTETPRNSQPTPQYGGMSSIQRERSGISYPSGANTQRSQKSILTAMPAGSQVDDFVNDASTTTSGKKTSDHSNRSSVRWNTQSSNGVGPGGGRRDVPDFSGVESKTHGDSQLPDTQEVASSQGSAPHSSSQPSQPTSHQGSQPPVPAFNAPGRPSHTPSIQALLNNPSQTEQSSPHPEFILDHAFIDGLHEALTHRTSGCSIEQLEQVNTALMDSVWQQRGEWNRTKVGTEVGRVFNVVMEDIEEMQQILPSSLETRQIEDHEHEHDHDPDPDQD